MSKPGKSDLTWTRKKCKCWQTAQSCCFLSLFCRILLVFSLRHNTQNRLKVHNIYRGSEVLDKNLIWHCINARSSRYTKKNKTVCCQIDSMNGLNEDFSVLSLLKSRQRSMKLQVKINAKSTFVLNLRIEWQHHTIFLKCSHHVHCTYCL